MLAQVIVGDKLLSQISTQHWFDCQFLETTLNQGRITATLNYKVMKHAIPFMLKHHGCKQANHDQIIEVCY